MSTTNLNDDNTDVLAGFTELANYISDKDVIVDDDGNIVDPIKPDDEPSEPSNPDSNITEPDNLDISPADGGIVDPKDFADPDDLNDPNIVDSDNDPNDLDNDPPIDSDSDSDNDPDNLDDETEMISPFVDLFTEELGWELDDEEKPKNIKELISFMNDMVTEGSKPRYHSEQIKQLDEYVRNGGNIEDFFNKTSSGIDINNIDMSKENNQKAVIKEYLKETNPNYSDEYINRKINRYEESGVLEEEAEDTIDLLKDHYAKKEEKLLKDQEKQYQQKLKEQQKFVSTVEDTIKNTESLFGLPVNTAQKKELIERLLKVDAQGRTKYQVEYSKDPIKGLIENAFIQMNKKTLLDKLENKANNNAVSKFKNKLNTTKKNKRGKDQQRYQSTGGSLNLISQVSSQLM
jgi:hypothetical protein